MPAFRILAIDGGGIRGIIPAIFLSKIAERLGTDSINTYFDLVAGTSTGSLIAGIAANGENIHKCCEFYKKLGPKIFPPMTSGRRPLRWMDILTFGPTYKEEDLASSLQQLFGLPRILGDAKTKLLVTSYDVSHRQIHLMRSYESQDIDIPLWEACKASCSAPTYFPAHILKQHGLERPLIDGGVFCNNPSMVALSEAIKLRQKDSIREFQKENRIILISLGTGSLLRKISAEQALSWGAIRWAKPIIDVLFDGTSEAAHMSARQIVSTENYVRMQVDLRDVNDDLDDASLENIKELEDLARSYLQTDSANQQIDHIVELLKENVE